MMEEEEDNQMTVGGSTQQTMQSLHDPSHFNQDVIAGTDEEAALIHSESTMSLRRWELEEQTNQAAFSAFLPNCTNLSRAGSNFSGTNPTEISNLPNISNPSDHNNSNGSELASSSQLAWLFGHSRKQEDLLAKKPWASDPNYFQQVQISALAALKMVVHCTQGGQIEVMGMLIGRLDLNMFLVLDAVPLPVEGTETRVNAQAVAYEFMAQHMQHLADLGRTDKMIGWYHSHPGYGCWLSGIDVETQSMHQAYEDPFLAIVIDPINTMSTGKINLGAFRTFPENYLSTNSAADKSKTAVSSFTKKIGQSNGGPGMFSSSSNIGSSAHNDPIAPPHSLVDYQVIPSDKIADFGAFCNRYYSLEVAYFKTDMEATIIRALWNKYWCQTLSSSGILAKPQYVDKAAKDLLEKLESAERCLSRPQLSSTNNSTQLNTQALVNCSRDAQKLAVEETKSLMNLLIKQILFSSNPV